MLLLVVAGLPLRAVHACATCLCGDPTITTMGTEKPFAGRLRFNASFLSRAETVGEPGVSEHKIDETRYTYSVSYAPREDWILAASLPVVEKEVERFDLSHERASGIGDSDLSARWYLQNDHRHLSGIQLGLRVPTSSEQKSAGQPIDFDAQPGAGATLPSIGLWYGLFQAPRFYYASVVYQYALDEGYQGYQAGDVWLITAHAQHDFGYRFSLSFSLDGRWKDYDRYFDVIDDDSGGGLIMATPGINWTPATDWVVSASYQVPIVENLNGRQSEEANIRFEVTYDF
jgi:hypothetical protein